MTLPESTVRVAALTMLLALAASLAAVPAGAAQRALLVGVSDYPTLPVGYQRTPGARNDVQLLRQALRQRGFEPEHIRLLADGVPGAEAPTHANILRGLDELAEASQPGDVVFVHLAGHGSMEPQLRAGESASPIFLPIDIGRWDGQVGRVERALTRGDLRTRIDRISARGAFVWGVFDTCHSATFVRGADQGPARRRFITPAALGLPRAMAAGTEARDSGAAGMPGGPAAASVGRGGTVFFYAAQAGEAAVELPLPRGAATARQHGLLSFHVAAALQGRRPVSYRQLGQSILTAYLGTSQAYATPVFTGDALDHLVLGQRAAPVWQWPLRLNDGLQVDAGTIFGLVPGAVLGVVETPTAAEGEFVGHLRVVAADVERATLAPAARDGKPAPEVSALRAGQYLRLVESPPIFALRVAVDASRCPGACSVGEAVARLRQLDIPGVDVQWVDGSELADVMVHLGEGRVTLRMSAQSDLPGARDRPPGADLDAKGGQDALAARLGQHLHAVARVRNLLALALRKANDAAVTGLTVQVRRAGSLDGAGLILRPDTLARLSGGDVLTAELGNAGAVAVDVTVLHLDAQHGIKVLFPGRSGESNRLPAGTRRLVEAALPHGLGAGPERLLVIARQARAGSDRSDFSFLSQPSLVRVRGRPEEDLGIFADAAFAEYRRLGLSAPRPARGAIDVQLFTFIVQGPPRATRAASPGPSR